MPGNILSNLLRSFRRVFSKSVDKSPAGESQHTETTEIKEPVQKVSAEKKARRKQIFIGFDFGTSSTKICYYDYFESTHHFFVFNKESNDIGRYCKPSIVRFENGRISFSESSGGKSIELFKVNIHKNDYEINFENELVKFSASDIAAVHCAHILSLVTRYLNTKFYNPKLFYQFGIPVDHISNTESPDSEKEKCFRRSFGMAILMSQKGIDLEKLTLKELKSVLINYENEFNLIQDHDMLFTIYPETIAGVGALLRNRTISMDKSYSIVDIGAGTTDISFFRYGNIYNPEGTISVYHSKTIDTGSQNLHNVEKAKQNIGTAFKGSFGYSYWVYPKFWDSNFKLLFLGGGSRSKLKNFINNVELTIHGHGLHREIIECEKLKFPIPKNAYDGIEQSNTEWKKWFDFLAVSFGLSHPGPDLPGYNPQVPQMPPDDLAPAPYEPLTPDVG